MSNGAFDYLVSENVKDGKPPGGRPGTPPLDKTPPSHQPIAPSSSCETSTSMSPEAFWGNVREVIRREFIRLARGTEGVDAGYTLTPAGEIMIDQMIEAFQAGKKVPGLPETSDQEGNCTMNWEALACFARYYGGKFLNGDQRQYIREQLSAGVSAKDLMKDELLGTNWYICTGQEPQDEKEVCCPNDVINDWYYKDLSKGVTPNPNTGTSWGTVALIGLGVLGVAMTLRLLAGVHKNPASAAPSMHGGRTPEEKKAVERRKLRSRIAHRHSFEVWDETRDYLTGSGLGAPSYVFDAIGDLRGLVDDINATGSRTNEINELDRILDLSAGVS